MSSSRQGSIAGGRNERGPESNDEPDIPTSLLQALRRMRHFTPKDSTGEIKITVSLHILEDVSNFGKIISVPDVWNT